MVDDSLRDRRSTRRADKSAKKTVDDPDKVGTGKSQSISTQQKMDTTIAVVSVAGLGTRLLPATKSQPKEMLPVGRKPGGIRQSI